MLARLVLSPFIFLAGISLMKYTVQVTNFTGKIGFAEKYLGGGLASGTYTFWRLFGLLLCVVAALWLFGLLPHGAV